MLCCSPHMGQVRNTTLERKTFHLIHVAVPKEPGASGSEALGKRPFHEPAEREAPADTKGNRTGTWGC